MIVKKFERLEDVVKELESLYEQGKDELKKLLDVLEAFKGEEKLGGSILDVQFLIDPEESLLYTQTLGVLSQIVEDLKILRSTAKGMKALLAPSLDVKGEVVLIMRGYRPKEILIKF